MVARISNSGFQLLRISHDVGAQANFTSTSFHFPDLDKFTFVRVRACLITWIPNTDFLQMALIFLADDIDDATLFVLFDTTVEKGIAAFCYCSSFRVSSKEWFTFSLSKPLLLDSIKNFSLSVMVFIPNASAYFMTKSLLYSRMLPCRTFVMPSCTKRARWGLSLVQDI